MRDINYKFINTEGGILKFTPQPRNFHPNNNTGALPKKGFGSRGFDEPLTSLYYIITEMYDKKCNDREYPPFYNELITDEWEILQVVILDNQSCSKIYNLDLSFIGYNVMSNNILDDGLTNLIMRSIIDNVETQELYYRIKGGESSIASFINFC